MNEPLIVWGGALTLVVLALLIGWLPLRMLWLERRRQRLISQYGVARLDNVVLDDGMGGSRVLEHVLLTPAGLLVLLPRYCDGALFGAEKIDRWTQMNGGKSFHFTNPLHQLEDLLATLKYHFPGLPIEGRILFTGKCTFPKGRPEHLMLLNEMSGQDGRVDQAILPVLEEAWASLQDLPRAEKLETAPEHRVPVFRLWLSVLLMLGAAAWFGWLSSGG